MSNEWNFTLLPAFESWISGGGFWPNDPNPDVVLNKYKQ